MRSHLEKTAYAADSTSNVRRSSRGLAKYTIHLSAAWLSSTSSENMIETLLANQKLDIGHFKKLLKGVCGERPRKSGTNFPTKIKGSVL